MPALTASAANQFSPRQRRRRTRLIAIASASSVLALVLASAQGASGRSAGREADQASSRILTIGMPGDVETLDGAFAHEQISNEVRYNTFDRFFRYAEAPGPGGVPVYDVKKILGEAVESWRVSPNGRAITLNVRRGAQFCHTGNPATADDFVYWFARTFGVKGSSLFNVQAAYIPSAKAVEKTGRYQLRIRFSKPSPLFFYLYRDQAQAPIDMKAYKAHATKSDPWATHWAAKHDGGSGPYCVSRSLPGAELDLQANPGYWGPKPYFNQVILKVQPSSTDRVLLLQRGSIDVAEQLSTDELDRLRHAGGVKVLSIPTRNQILVGLNSKKKPFDNKLVRQALSYAVPYDTIVKSVYGGHALKPDSVIAISGDFHRKGTWPYRFDLDKAKALLTKAGYPNGFSMSLYIQTGNSTFEELAVLLQSTFGKIGVKVNIVKQPPATFANGLNNKSDQAWLRDLLWYVDDPGYTGDIFYKTTAVLNWMAYSNPRLDRIIAQMAALWRPGDRGKKAALGAQYQKILADDAPTLILAQTNFELAVRNNICGYQQLPDNLLQYYTLRRC
jgi:peptide/nickel transport system substrate-binding protein